jgi:hypothetical protein
LRYQQDLTGRRLAILVLPTANWPKTRVHTALIAEAVSSLRAGDFVELNLD